MHQATTAGKGLVRAQAGRTEYAMPCAGVRCVRHGSTWCTMRGTNRATAGPQGHAPWEARTPDLEVNGLTLWPAELRKLLSVTNDMEQRTNGSSRRTMRVFTWGQVPAAEARSLGGSNSRP